MVRRKNRRWLVAVTYATLLVLLLTLGPHRHWNQGMNVGTWLLLAVVFVSRGVFGSLVNQTMVPERRGEPISLGLAPMRHRDEDEPDERELAVRNAAYFEAYRVLAVYSAFLVLYSSTSFGAFALPLIAMPLLVMALTLPQAVILWTEPDVPEEARV